MIGKNDFLASIFKRLCRRVFQIDILLGFNRFLHLHIFHYLFLLKVNHCGTKF